MTDKEKWNEVMDLAQKYEFIVMAYGGVAILATPENKKSVYRERELAKLQEVNKFIGEVKA